MKSNEILSLLASGLEAATQAHTAVALGDRRTYLGMSDLARGLSCPRAVVAGKLAPEPAGQSLEKLLTLRRGHWLEYGIEEALAAVNTKFISQLEISIQQQGVPIKAHLDLVLPDETASSITVLELKSVGHLREQVYGSHEAQLYGQIGLLRQFWSQPVFSVARQFEKSLSEPSGSEYCSFPDLARRQLGIELANDVSSASIQGFVLTVSPNAARAFGPYEPNLDVLDLILKTGRRVWQSLAEIRSGRALLADIPYQQGFAPLCDCCGHNRDCPKFQGGCDSDLEPELTALTDLKAARSDLEAEIREREDQLKALAALLGRPGQWINGRKHRFRVSSQAGRVTLDQNLLKTGLTQAGGLAEAELASLLASVQKTGRSFERLQISPINTSTV